MFISAVKGSVMDRCWEARRAAVVSAEELGNVSKQRPAGGKEAVRVGFPGGGWGGGAPGRGSSQHNI